MKIARWILALWLAVAALMPSLAQRAMTAPAMPPLSELELTPQGWRAGPGELTDIQRFFVLEKEGRPFMDEMLLATFSNNSGAVIDTQIFYHRTRENNAWGDFADMVNCWHGRFRQVSQNVVELRPGIRATQLTMEKEDERASALYWMQSRDRTSASGWQHVLWQHVQALRLERGDACFVKISYAGPHARGRDAALLDVGRHVHERLERWFAEGNGGR